jgi:gamma-glutamylaminecyclotransferase
MAKTTLFVYGTLKRGQRNHGFLAGQEFVAEAPTLPRYRLYVCGGSPCLVDDAVRGMAVQGEVWRVDDDALARMDELEEVPTLYTRRAIGLADFAGPVAAYFYNGDVTRCRDCVAGEWPAAR